MAKFFLILLALLASFLPPPPSAASSNDAEFIKPMDMSRLGAKHEKLSHFRLYWHDIVSGKNPTTAVVIPPVNNSKSLFGITRMIDNTLTLGPKISSKCVGRAQGFYASAALDEVGLYMSMNFVFIEGKYNGSSISIQGRNPVFEKVREMPVVGGSGLFRFARGYAKIQTVWFDTKSGDAVVEYNVYVLHY